MVTETAVNWDELIAEFIGSGMTIKGFIRKNGCSERAFKYHLYKDPRYTPKAYKKDTVKLIPVTVEEQKRETVRINGFDIDICAGVGDETLAKVLSAIRKVS